MNSLVLGRGHEMSSEADGGSWAPVIVGAIGAVTTVLSFFAGSLRAAAKAGRLFGDLERWQKGVDASVAAQTLTLAATETRLMVEINSLKSRDGEIEKTLRDVATRQEVKDQYEDLKTEISKLGDRIYDLGRPRQTDRRGLTD